MVGGSRGLGSELLNSMSMDHEIIATTRDIEKADGSVLLHLDLSDFSTFDKFLHKLGKKKFDLVLFIAAFTVPEDAEEEYVRNLRFGNLDYSLFEEMIKVNCFSQIKVFELLAHNDLISEDAKICFFSSRAGAISTRGRLPHHQKGGNLTYRISKGALNVAVKNLAYDFNTSGLTIVALHPGWVKTEAGGGKADMETRYATEQIISFLNNLTKNDSGKFFDLTGQILEW
jgi:NAD(P)-dependent dehydrogenase (short-subunit alcohol dehydrogenase family)